MRFRLATWSVVAMSLIAALVPFAAVLIFLHHKKKGREVRLGGRAAGDNSVRFLAFILDPSASATTFLFLSS